MTSLLPQQAQQATPTGQMIVCGDDALATRLATELHDVYGELVTLLVPPPSRSTGAGQPAVAPNRARASALFGRVSAALTRADGGDVGTGPSGEFLLPVREVEATEPSEEALREAGAQRAAALALVYDDDETNIRAALTARRLNPRLRLVIRLYNRKLGQHLEELLDQAAMVTTPGLDPAALDASTTVLSDADTAAPALAATAVAGTSKVVQADGLLLRAVERSPPGRGEVADPGLCTLALLSSTTNDPAGSEGSERSGVQGPLLLPDDATVAAATGRGTVVLEAVSYAGPPVPPRRLAGRGSPARLSCSRGGCAGRSPGSPWPSSPWPSPPGLRPVATPCTPLISRCSTCSPSETPPSGSLLARQVLQLLAGLVGLALLPVLVAAALEALGAFRGSHSLLRPPRGLSGHVVLLGLGKIGTRVLARLRELDIPVVCVEEDPEARGVPLARRLRVPVVLGDVTQEGVLEAAKIHRAHALLALTSADTTNLEAALYARGVKPDLRVALRLYDDDFATAVYRTLRAAHPDALTRSRSVSTLAAPAFAGAMMGRQILGAIPVERRVLLFAALVVAGHPQFEGRTVAEAFRPGAWRVIALDTAEPAERRPDLAAARPDDADRTADGLLWDLHPGYVLRAEDRVVLAATRRGLAELLGRRPPGPVQRTP